MKCDRCDLEIKEGTEVFVTEETAKLNGNDARMTVEAMLCPFCADTVYYMIVDPNGKGPYTEPVFPRAEGE